MAATYREVEDCVRNCLVKVPKPGSYMRYIEPHEAGGPERTVPIPGHWRSSAVVGGIIVQRNFYGLTKDRFGRKVVGDVKVEEKTTHKGIKVVLISIDVALGYQTPERELKISNGKGKVGVVFQEI